ncbi:macrophage mannose receptor 1-like [Ruditapes philippinarum]|uniref:macrophage mannose receptor 1-like n=1 Tax=Ruditapes philippinarum TaxID=129788 RepID=UPI00295B521D|nr:macrophage mannose receptor 1-like [Ruditapes philippinarum]
MYFFLLNVFIRGEKDIFWLGLNDRDNEGQFVWHMSGKSPSFTDWYQKEPDNLFNSEHCVSLFNARDEYKWRDDNCDRSYNYICEIDATDVQITESITTEQQEVITTSSVTMFKMETSTMAISEGDRCVIKLTAVIAVMVLHFSFLIMF